MLRGEFGGVTERTGHMNTLPGRKFFKRGADRGREGAVLLNQKNIALKAWRSLTGRRHRRDGEGARE